MRQGAGRSHRRSVIASVTAAVLAISGLIALGIGLLGQSGRAPSDAAMNSSASASASASASNASSSDRSALTAVRITIPAIGADSSLAQLGLAGDSSDIELPPRAAQAGWYTKSPAPGQPGAAIVTGYISDGGSAGPFNNLQALDTGDEILVGRSDGQTVTFTVTKITTYPQGQFDADAVYASTNDPELRVITVGGVLHADDAPENVVVFAKMTSIDDTRISAPTFHPTTTSPPAPTPTPAPSSPASAPTRDGMPRSQPKTLRIPSIGVDAAVDQVGLAKDKKNMELPPHPDRAAWYDQSFTPGQAGVSILAGYVRSTKDQPGVFANVGKLKIGAAISVERADKTIATFRVAKSAFYPDGKLPAADIYAPSAGPELRIITVGGPFGPKGATGNYVVFATLSTTGR